jgi:hypothetical protein
VGRVPLKKGGAASGRLKGSDVSGLDITNASTGLNGCTIKSRSCVRRRVHALLSEYALLGTSRSVLLRHDRRTVTAVLAQKGCQF